MHSYRFLLEISHFFSSLFPCFFFSFSLIFLCFFLAFSLSLLSFHRGVNQGVSELVFVGYLVFVSQSFDSSSVVIEELLFHSSLNKQFILRLCS